MSSPQHCLAMAEEADRLAGIVSYERDKERLRVQAAAWRRMATVMTEPTGATVPPGAARIAPAPRAFAMTGWLKRRRA